MTNLPIQVNRLHTVWLSEIVGLELIDVIGSDDYDELCWLIVRTKDGSKYNTELSTKVDPQCPVNPRELKGRIERLASAEALVRSAA